MWFQRVRERQPPLREAGSRKTGTAEIVDEDSGTRNNAWFIGFVSDSKSKVAIALVLEDMPSGQTGGKAAAPLAGKILKKAVDLGY